MTGRLLVIVLALLSLLSHGFVRHSFSQTAARGRQSQCLQAVPREELQRVLAREYASFFSPFERKY